jgi:hypothetical protein
MDLVRPLLRIFYYRRANPDHVSLAAVLEVVNTLSFTDNEREQLSTVACALDASLETGTSTFPAR